ncbi:MAG TPA: hypothetical protein VGJ81_21485 [Thermoanaerobaculia bacterium]
MDYRINSQRTMCRSFGRPFRAPFVVTSRILASAREVTAPAKPVRRHMSDAPVTISVILDPSYGSKVQEAAQRGPVWMTGSPENQEAAREFCATVAAGHCDVTLWDDPRTGETEEEWLDIPDDLELHHSEDWAGPGIAGIQVVGCPPHSQAQAALREFGYFVT